MDKKNGGWVKGGVRKMRKIQKKNKKEGFKRKRKKAFIIYNNLKRYLERDFCEE